jgi:hypothetical protein
MTRPRDLDAGRSEGSSLEGSALDADFERRLFDSARDDAPPAGQQQRAWSRFAAHAGALSSGVSLREPRPLGWWQSPAATAAKWTLIGAVAGGSAVAVWLRPAPSAAPAAPIVAAAEQPPPPPPPPPPSVPAPTVSAEVPPERALPAPARSAPRPTRALKAQPAAPSAAERESLLAREVAALDAARRSLAIGNGESARQQIDQYHRDFPGGELSADADVVAIEALAADADGAALQRAAQSFLERYPLDPHAARIRELLRRAGASPP